MDSRLEKALDFSNYMITLNNQKRILKEQFQNDLIYYYNGGTFTVTQELVSFCQSLIGLHQTGTILIDNNNIPIEIENLETFADSLVSVYWKAANKYYTEYDKLKTNRSVKGIVDL